MSEHIDIPLTDCEAELYIQWANARIKALEDKDTALRSLLKEAGEVLEPFALAFQKNKTIVFDDLRRAADIARKIEEATATK